MQIKFLQKKPFFIFVIENFLSDFEYKILNENLNKVQKKVLPGSISTLISSRDCMP